MKVYRGKRHKDGEISIWIELDGKQVGNLVHRVRHSPAGLNWGYWGSGPADLARSLCWDVLGREPSARVYQQIKTEFVAGFGDEWEISESALREAIEAIDRAHGLRDEELAEAG